MEIDINQFHKDKNIDPGRLDIECIRQPDRFFFWAQAAVVASTELDRAKLHLDLLKVQLELECRQNPTDFGVVKPTEAAIDAAVKCHPKYQAANEAYNKAKSDSKLLDAAVATMEQKKRMLENLITLHGQQYFAGPSVPRDLVSEWKEHQEKLETNINEQQKSLTRRRGEK